MAADRAANTLCSQRANAFRGQAAQIAAFGFTNPIVIGADDVIIAGPGRLFAAKLFAAGDPPA